MTPLCPIRCRCGQFHAELAHPERTIRLVCYCKDCQIFAHFLGLPHGMLDSLGGTDIVAARPYNLTFKSGVEHLACMRLTASGVLRWYTSCCHTPMGNTLHNFKVAHVGLVHSAFAPTGGNLDDLFGPVRMRVHRGSARGAAPSIHPATVAGAALRHMVGLGWSRVSGKYKVNPYFDASTGKPRVAPRVLGSAELANLRSSL